MESVEPMSRVRQDDDYWGRTAAELVEGNRERYPELLVEQLAGAMRREASAIEIAYRQRIICAVCLRLADRAGVKPKGDEVGIVKVARELTHCTPSLRGGNGWITADEAREAIVASEQLTLDSEEAA